MIAGESVGQNPQEWKIIDGKLFIGLSHEAKIIE